MKKILFVLLFYFITQLSFSQTHGLGFGLGGLSTGGMEVDIFYKYKNHRFHVGGAIQFSKRLGKSVSEILPNYGQTVDSEGNYYAVFDVAYSHIIRKKITAMAEFSTGAKNYYTNYIDGRFTGGGYNYTHTRQNLIGFGGAVGYLHKDFVEFYAGYNTVKGVKIGVKFQFTLRN